MHNLNEAVHSLHCASTETKDNEDNDKMELQLQVESLTRDIEKLRTERGWPANPLEEAKAFMRL
jgi:hypothetical protein